MLPHVMFGSHNGTGACHMSKIHSHALTLYQWLTHNSCYLDAAFKRGVMRALDVQLWCYSTAVFCTVHSHLTRVLVKEKRKIENTLKMPGIDIAAFATAVA